MKKRLFVLAAIGAVLAPSVAHAHLVATGMGPIYDGVVHLMLSPEDGLPVVALALFAGLRGAAHSRLLLWVLPIAWFAAGLLTVLAGRGAIFPPVPMAMATAGVFMLIGGLLAADLDLPPSLAAVLAAALGLLRGMAGVTGVSAGAATTLTILGMSLTVFVLFALASSISLPLRRFWMIVAIRVTGGWFAAAGMLLAGWIMRYGARVQ